MTLLKKIRARILWLLFIIALFTGCKRADKTSQYTIGFSQCVGSDLWRRTMLDEMKMELSLHPGVKFIYADADNNSKKQVEQVKSMINEGIDLLIISPNEAQPLTNIVEQTYNKGIPVIVIDRKTASGLYTAYVGANNYQIGKLAGEYAAGILKGKGNVLEVMGLPGSSPAIERDRGFNDGIKKFRNIHITAQVYGDWLKNNAEKQLIRIKSSLNNISAVFAQNDVMALGSRDVFNKVAYKHPVKIIGVDAIPGPDGGLQMVDSKIIDASVLYPTGGKEAITTAFKILNKEPFLKENILQTLVIDSTNVQLMKLQWNKVSSQQKDIERQKALIEEQKQVYNDQQVILNITVITLVLAIVFGGLAFYSLMENRKINKSLAAKNDEILMQRNKLIEMSVMAEAATEAKLNFFTNISHEFRTPLTLMLSPVEDLMSNEKLSTGSAKNLKLIHKNIFRLLRLINQLIDYRKIEYDKQQLNLTRNDIIGFVREIMESFKQNAKKRNISMNLIAKEHELIILFDVDMLDKVFYNLLSNALKFTKDNGRIDISFIKDNDEYISIEVKDNGVGLAPEEAIHVFDQFYQADNAIGKGSGLGLALSSEIIKLHKGTIAINSKKWEGTTFSIILPVGDFVGEDLKPKEIGKIDQTEKAKVYTTDLDYEKIDTNANAFALPKDQSVLIIEDNTDLLHYLAEKLGNLYEVFTADNGNSGVFEAYEKVPDLIISDVMLPGITGKNIAELLKTDLRTSHIPIVLLTAQCSVENQIDGIQSMADAYITKPFNYDYLLATVKNLIQNRAILKEHFTSDISASGRLPISRGLDKKFVSDFAGIVEQNLSNEKFNVDDISKAIGISRIQLYRKVKALLGCNITDYILSRRLKKAKYLLLHENYSISEITYMVGFSSPNYFSTVFKQKYNCTPSEFKRNQHA